MRRQLAQHISPGPYNLNQFGLVLRVLQCIFVPETSNQIHVGQSVFLAFRAAAPATTTTTSSPQLVSIDQNSLFATYSADVQIRFVNDVLLPETIIRLIMADNEITYAEADKKMIEGYDDIGWVDRVFSIRNSFLLGQESLKNKNKTK